MRQRILAWLADKAPSVHHFLTREDKPWPLVREIGSIALILLVGVTLLWGLTGQGFPDETPVVVIESGSMMHCTNGLNLHGDGCQRSGPYGRFGTIDPGDLVFVNDVAGRDDVRTYAQGGDGKYGKAGDVIIYNKDGLGGTPIIHRAMFWLEVHDTANITFSVAELDIEDVPASGLAPLAGSEYAFSQQQARNLENALLNLRAQGVDITMMSGFVTRGDNNPGADQGGGIAIFPVQPEWILGKAGGELPWIGLIKLKFSDLTAGSTDYDNAPGDVKAMMWLTIIVVIAGPFVVERGVRFFKKDEVDDAPDVEDTTSEDAAEDEADDEK